MLQRHLRIVHNDTIASTWLGDSKDPLDPTTFPWEINADSRATRLNRTIAATARLRPRTPTEIVDEIMATNSVGAALSEVNLLLCDRVAANTDVSIVKEELNDDGSKRRKKRNRWGDATENKAAGLMGLPTAIMANMTSEQLEAYTLHFRIDEITQKLRIDDVVPADGDRHVLRATTPHNHLTFADPHRPLRSTTTLVGVSTLASSVTESVLRTSATS